MYHLQRWLLLLCLLPLQSVADTQPLTYDRISFAENAGADVDNDTLVAVLYVQREGRRAQDLARVVNSIMNKALQTVEGIDQIKTQTQAYRTNAVYKENEIAGWRVHQSVRLESRDSRLLGDTIGTLQEWLNVQSISYRVSDEQRRQYSAELIETALQRFQQRAKLIADSLGRKGYRLVSLRINDGQGPMPMPVEMRMDRMSAKLASPAPRIEAGTQRIEVTVSGEIELLD